MEREPSKPYSPLLYQYLKQYQENPESRIFAPLAEAYRKAGLTQEAIEIARDGLRVHPHFIGGKVALARALFDERRYSDVIEALESVLKDAPDNLIASRLLGESYLLTQRHLDALSVFKLMLYYSPQDAELGTLVRELETSAYELEERTHQEKLKAATPAESTPVTTKTQWSIDPAEAALWVRRVEMLQSLLPRIERYRRRRPE